MRKIVSVATAALCLATSAQAGGDPLHGTWLTQDGGSRIRVAHCGRAVCATIVWVREPGADTHNPDPEMRHRDMVGIALTRDMRPDPHGGWAGSIYNPDDGRTYSATMKLAGPDRLEVGGCVMAGLLCGSEVWSRQPDEIAAAAGGPVQRR